LEDGKKMSHLQPAAIAAGVLVVGGIFFYSSRKKKKCTELKGIWDGDSPLHLTESGQSEAISETKRLIREYKLAGQAWDMDSMSIAVAKSLRECNWENISTRHQREVISGIKKIIESEAMLYRSNPDTWMASIKD